MGQLQLLAFTPMSSPSPTRPPQPSELTKVRPSPSGVQPSFPPSRQPPCPPAVLDPLIPSHDQSGSLISLLKSLQCLPLSQSKTLHPAVPTCRCVPLPYPGLQAVLFPLAPHVLVMETPGGDNLPLATSLPSASRPEAQSPLCPLCTHPSIVSATAC